MSCWRASAALAIILFAGPAQAHTFLPEGGFYDRFIEGNLVVLAYPATLLPLIALGLMASLWDPEGLLRVWPSLLLGQLVGIGLATMVGSAIVIGLLSAGAVVAIFAALLNAHKDIEVHLAAFAIGTLAVATSLEGHGFFELPVAIYIGILFATNLTVAVSSALPRVTMERNDAAWLRIFWRVVASWIGAILILYLAFTTVQ